VELDPCPDLQLLVAAAASNDVGFVVQELSLQGAVVRAGGGRMSFCGPLDVSRAAACTLIEE